MLKAESRCRDVIPSFKTPQREREIADHPSLKPQHLLRIFVRATAAAGQRMSILDPFMGSGSTSRLRQRSTAKPQASRLMRLSFAVAQKSIPSFGAVPGTNGDSLDFFGNNGRPGGISRTIDLMERWGTLSHPDKVICERARRTPALDSGTFVLSSPFDLRPWRPAPRNHTASGFPTLCTPKLRIWRNRRAISTQLDLSSTYLDQNRNSRRRGDAHPAALTFAGSLLRSPIFHLPSATSTGRAFQRFSSARGPGCRSNMTIKTGRCPLANGPACEPHCKLADEALSRGWLIRELTRLAGSRPERTL